MHARVGVRSNGNLRVYTCALHTLAEQLARVCVRKSEGNEGGREGRRREEGGYEEEEEDCRDRNEGTRRELTKRPGAGEKEITAGSDRVVEINVARLIGATEECACGLSGSQPARAGLPLVRRSIIHLQRSPLLGGAPFGECLLAECIAIAKRTNALSNSERCA